MISHRLAAQLISRGHEVELVSTRPAGTASYSVVEGVPVRRLFSFGNSRGIWRLGPYSYTALLYRYLLLQMPAYDLVHAQQAFHPAFAALMARRRTRRPVVVQLHTSGAYGDLLQMREGRPTFPLGSSKMLDVILKEADSIVAISGAIRDELLKYGTDPGRIAQIPNGVEVPPLPDEGDRMRSRSELDLPPDVSVAVYVGRAGKQKGSDLLIKAWKSIAATEPKHKLFLLGEGFTTDPVFMKSAKEIGSSLIVTGKVRDVNLYLRAADLFVFPSRGEGLSLAVLEAQSHGLPCLLSDLPANRDLVTEGRTGLFCRPEDWEDLRDRLLYALYNISALKPLGNAARHQVIARFSLGSIAAAFEDLYATLTKKY